MNPNSFTLADLGWNAAFAEHFEAWPEGGLVPARVSCQERQRYTILCEAGELKAQLAGRYRHQLRDRGAYPCVGDWVVVKPQTQENKAQIAGLLPRQSSFSRKAVLAGGPAYGEGKTEEHILAANVDTVFLVCGLDRDFNLRRIERYIAVAWESAAKPVLVLNKTDAALDLEGQLAAAEQVAMGVPICATSALQNEGLNDLRAHLGPGRTIALLGSSGVGKSTLINSLLGAEVLRTGPLREHDQRGRHTTTHREMILMPGSGILIDTPGLREIQIWGEEESVTRAFEDIEELGRQCRFRNCSHQSEPGCAIREAIEAGDLDPKRYRNYLRLLREAEILSVRRSQRARIRRYGN